MKSRRENHRQQNIEWLTRKITRTSLGKIEWVLGLFLMQFLFIFVMFEMQISDYMSTSSRMEDALATGGLASALIDIQRYGSDHVMVITDAENAYGIYKSSLADNLGCEVSEVGSDLSYRYYIEEYRIYNVEENQVFEVSVDDNGVKSASIGPLGSVRAPNGDVIRTTGVYSEISFDKEGLFGIVTRAKKGKLVEINRNE